MTDRLKISDVLQGDVLQGDGLPASTGSDGLARFVAAMGHDLRTPLSAVTGYSGLMLDAAAEEGLSEQAIADLSNIREAGGRMLWLLNAVIDLAKLQAGTIAADMQSVDLLAEVAVTLKEARRRGEVSEKLPEGAITLQSDPAILRRGLSHMLEAGRGLTADGNIALIVEQDGEGVRIAVRINGADLTPDDLQFALNALAEPEAAIAARAGEAGISLCAARAFASCIGAEISVLDDGDGVVMIELRLPAV